HRLVEGVAATGDEAATSIAAIPENGYRLEVTERSGDVLRVKVTETETSTALFVDLPAELLSSPSYEGLRRTYARLGELVGLPPFSLSTGKKTASAETFAELRAQSLELAKEGMQISRFK